MAKSVWVGVSPSSGSGNANIAISSTAQHTGREVRSSNVTFKAANCEDVVVAVNQAGKPENVSISASAAPPKMGQILTISGTTNSSKLTFAWGTGTLDLALPDTYKANSVDTDNGVAIAGDPGAIAQIPFSIAITVPANDSVSTLTKQLIVTDDAGNSDICLITQAAGDAYLTVTPLTVELDWEGSAETVAVSSNVAWTIS